MSFEFDEIEKTLLTADAMSVAELRCPRCASGLVAIFTEVKGRKSLNIRCKNACYRTNLDGISKVPAWVATLGKRLETQ